MTSVTYKLAAIVTTDVTVMQASSTSASGQNRKSSVSFGMSVVGGRPEVDFERLEVRF